MGDERAGINAGTTGYIEQLSMVRKINLFSGSLGEIHAATIHRRSEAFCEILAFHRFGPFLFIFAAGESGRFSGPQNFDHVLADWTVLQRAIVRSKKPLRAAYEVLAA